MTKNQLRLRLYPNAFITSNRPYDIMLALSLRGLAIAIFLTQVFYV